MACTHRFIAAPLRRAAVPAAPGLRACIRRPLERVHGVPTAFISLCGFTALLSTAVRKA